MKRVPSIICRYAGLTLIAGALFYFSVGESVFLAEAQATALADPQDAEGYFERASSRYAELKAWQKEKNWEAVYDKGPGYKAQIIADLDQVLRLGKDNADLAFRATFLRWQVVLEDDADAAFGLFHDVVARAKDAASSKDSMATVKKAADELLVLEDKNLSRRLYEVYVQGLAAAGLSAAELKAQADVFLAEKNIYLAKAIFDMSFKAAGNDPGALALERVAVADRFAHQDTSDGADPVYAEELYKQASSVVSAVAETTAEATAQVAWPADSSYRRAFNLERLRDFVPAIDAYKKFLEGFALDARAPEVCFRLGVLTAYATKDIATARTYFFRIKDEFGSSPLAVSALYQLGLLSQGQGANDEAKGYYNAALDAARSLPREMTNNELRTLINARLLEIDEGKEMKYGLRLFLEGALDTEALPLYVDLVGRPAKSVVSSDVRYAVTTSNPQTGCMTPTYAYEWSGETGSLGNIPNSVEIATGYPEVGLKVVHVAVVGTAGTEGVGFEIVEIRKAQG